MCLLFTRTAGVSANLSDAWLKDFYSHNKDGFGVMYAKDGGLHVDKGIGSVDDWIKFYREYEGLTAAFHLRMRTHGNIDLTNCHPYEVYGNGAEMPIYMMHNGVLSHGNAKDTSKSDTWHFIRDYIIPLSAKDPAVMFTPEMQAVLGKFIGNNRFAFMNHLGQLQIVNKNQGVEWQGMWLSNTYAWDYYGAFPEKRVVYQGYRNDGWNTARTTSIGALPDKKATGKKKPQPAPTKRIASDYYDDIVTAYDDISIRSKTVAEKVKLVQLDRLFKEFGTSDAWAWIEAFSYSSTKNTDAEKQFIEGLEDPRKVKDWLNAVEAKKLDFPVF
jgi:hypothetical protein